MAHKILTFICCLAVIGTASAQSSDSPNEGARLTYNAPQGSYNLTWWGRAGRTYFIQVSEDLIFWDYLQTIEPGADRPIEYGISSNAPRLFIRLKWPEPPIGDPNDFDGDKVTNWLELLQGTDPLRNLDTDANGLPDDWEIRYFQRIGVSPTDDSDGDGTTNLQEFQANTDPTDPAPQLTLTAPSGALLVP